MTRQTLVRVYVGAVVAAAILSVRNGLLFGMPHVPLFTLVSLGSLALMLDLGGVSLAHKARGSISFIVHIAVAVMFGPTWGALSSGVSILGSDIAIRKEPIRILFNVAQRVL